MQPLPLPKMVEVLIICLPFSLITAYQFEIAQQTLSPLEDKLNKPNRPIPAGLITVDRARTRWILSWILTTCIFYLFCGANVALWACVSQFVTLFFYVWPAFNHVICRNLFTGVISIPLHRGLNAVFMASATELELPVAVDLALALWLSSTIHLQEFRDAEGDRLSNKKTLATILSSKGLSALRIITAAIMVGWAILVYFYSWVTSSAQQEPTVFWTWVLCFIGASNVAVQLLFYDNDNIPKSTYHYFYYLAFWTFDLHLVLLAFS